MSSLTSPKAVANFSGPPCVVQFLPGVVYPSEGTVRREAGRQHMRAVLIYWLARNGWSHPNLERLATWALNEPGALHTSQISHIRNGKMRMVGSKPLDALGAINLCVWAYQNDRQLLRRMGAAPVTAQIEELIERAEPLLNPHTGQPLDQGALMMLYQGYLRLPQVVGGTEDNADLEKASLALGRFLAQQIQASGRDFITAKEVIEGVTPEPAMARKLIAVAAGLDTYDPEELRRDMVEVCAAVEALSGQPWTPARLLEELTR